MNRLNETQNEKMVNGATVKQFLPKPGFLKILKMGGAEGQIFTLREILKHLTNYIKLKKIYDPNDYHCVSCETDELGKVFGVNDFTDRTVLELIKKQVYLWPTNKRKGEPLDSEIPCKQQSLVEQPSTSKEPQKTSFCFPSSMFLVIPKYSSYESESDSPLSIQGYETEFAKDSSDDTLYSDSDEIPDVDETVEMRTYEVEFEVQSTDDNFSAPDTDSDIEDVVHTTMFATDSDMEFWADADESDDGCSLETDPELAFDRWMCKCGTENRAPYGHCSKCWAVRTGWLPDKKTSKPKKKKKKRKRNSQRSSHEESSQECAVDSASSSVDKDLDSSSSQLCSICLLRTKSATLVHGRTGHQVCCYPCGRKLEEMKKPCPVCRRTISKVIRNFII